MSQDTDPAVNDENPVAPAAAPTAADALAKAQAEAAEYKDAWLRAKAETENVRRIAREDVAKAHKFSIEKFAEDLLPVKDALEKALSTPAQTVDDIKAGAELTLKALDAAFARANVTEVNPAGSKFDPHQHEAMQMVPSAQSANTVVDVYQKGYLINDRVLRPALVTVATGGNADRSG
ncbi:MAG: nucleotide exchange factor GrpE [Burkholderiales bacterium]|nr:nucleotide exchange factor GrpE [Burkholderiales bacterium]